MSHTPSESFCLEAFLPFLGHRIYWGVGREGREVSCWDSLVLPHLSSHQHSSPAEEFYQDLSETFSLDHLLSLFILQNRLEIFMIWHLRKQEASAEAKGILPMKNEVCPPTNSVYCSVIVPSMKLRPRVGCDFPGQSRRAGHPLFSPSRKNRREEVRERGMGQKKGKCYEHSTL